MEAFSSWETAIDSANWRAVSYVDFINETASLVISAAGWTFDSTKTFCFLAIANRLLGNVD